MRDLKPPQPRGFLQPEKAIDALKQNRLLVENTGGNGAWCRYMERTLRNIGIFVSIPRNPERPYNIGIKRGHEVSPVIEQAGHANAGLRGLFAQPCLAETGDNE